MQKQQSQGLRPVLDGFWNHRKFKADNGHLLYKKSTRNYCVERALGAVMEIFRFGVTPQALFPVELWSQIFEEAVFIPGLLDTEILDPFESGAETPLTLCPSRTAVKLSLRTIHAVMLTCKSWHNVALPLLYRFIFIENQKQAAAVHWTLRASQEQAEASSDGTAISLGARVQHLMLSFNTNDASIAGSSAFWDNLLETVQSLPNLEILSGINRLSSAMVRDLSRVPYREYLCTMLIRSCKSSLRRLSFDGDADMFINLNIRDTFLYNFPHLQTITGGGSLLDCSYGMPAHANATALTIDGTESPCDTPHDPALASFPRATTAILRLTATHAHTRSWFHFLIAHGTQLHTIHLDLREARLPVLVSPTERALITAWCPQLTTLHLAVRHAADLHTVPELPHALTRLSMHVAVLEGDGAAAYMLATAAALAPPALEVLRFANADLSRALREHVRSSSVREFSPFAGRRVRLEDSQGRDLYLPA